MAICSDGSIVIDSSLCPDLETNINDNLNNLSYVVVSESGNKWIKKNGETVDIPEPDIDSDLNKPDLDIQKQSFNNSGIENDSTLNNVSGGLLTVLKENSRHIGQQLTVLSDVNKRLVESSDYHNDLLVVSLQLQSDNNLLLNKIFNEFTLLNKIKSAEVKNNVDIESLNVDLKIAEIVQNFERTEAIKNINDTLNTNSEVQNDALLKQIDYHSKQLQKLTFQIDGKSTLKDSDGNVIKPLEAQAKKDAEMAIGEHSENTFDWSIVNDITGIVSDLAFDVLGNVSNDSQELDEYLKNLIDGLGVNLNVQNIDNIDNRKLERNS